MCILDEHVFKIISQINIRNFNKRSNLIQCKSNNKYNSLLMVAIVL